MEWVGQIDNEARWKEKNICITVQDGTGVTAPKLDRVMSLWIWEGTEI